MEKLLALVIQHSLPYNLTLNTAKCQLLVTNDVGSPVHFPDRTLVQKHETIKYLGATFSSTLNVHTIVSLKITEAAAIMKTLGPLWSDSQISTSWKLVVYNATIRSKIFYTLDTLELTEGQQKQLDTIYFRGLRRILKKKSTFIERYWSNERLLRLANVMSGKTAPGAKKHISFSNYYKRQRTETPGTSSESTTKKSLPTSHSDPRKSRPN